METFPIKLGTIIWIIFLLFSIFCAYRVFKEDRKDDRKDDQNSKISLRIAILAVFVALFGIAWTEIPEIFNHRVYLSDLGIITDEASDLDAVDTTAESDNNQDPDQILLDGTKVSELGNRVAMSSIAYDDEIYHGSHILIVRPNNAHIGTVYL